MDAFAENNAVQPEGPEKSGLFHKLARLISRFRKKRKSLHFSRFYPIIADMSKKSAEYSDACLAVELCDEALNVIASRIAYIERLKSTEAEMLKYEVYARLDESDLAAIKEYQARLRTLIREKDELRMQVTSFDPSLARISDMEEAAAEAVPNIREAEKNQLIFRQDMHYLQGEKAELEYERETLLNGEVIIRRVILGAAGAFVLCALALGMAYVISGISIFVPLSIMLMLVIVMSALLFGFKRRLDVRLERNLQKQKKTVGLLNKKSAVFAHYTNFLNYSYRKYKVRSADMLSRNLKDYEHYKHLTRRYDAIRKTADETERAIIKFTGERGISISPMTPEDFSRLFNIDEKRDIYEALAQTKASIEGDLKTLDERQSRIWDAIVGLDPAEGGRVDMVIKSYIQESEKIIIDPIYLNDTPPDETSDSPS